MPYKQDVTGSSPVVTIYVKLHINFVYSAMEMYSSGRRGAPAKRLGDLKVPRGFESLHLRLLLRCDIMKKLYEVDERGIISELSIFSCGVAPCGGILVASESRLDVPEIVLQYRLGHKQLGTVYGVKGFDYPIKNCLS